MRNRSRASRSADARVLYAADVADVVVETFGCEPPETYVQAMVGREPATRWINLEYLSAEDWVEGSHKLPSPNPRLPLTKHYFFPGFTAKTGGSFARPTSFARRDAFQEEPGTQAAFGRASSARCPRRGAQGDLFTYERRPSRRSSDACARLAMPVWIVAPEGSAATLLASWNERGSTSLRHCRDVRRPLPAAGPLRRAPLGLRREFRPRRGLRSCARNLRGGRSFGTSIRRRRARIG
jgi:uncharacterized repeat protein (TIGR03837 family)